MEGERDYHRNENEAPEPSPRGPPEPEQPPAPQVFAPQSANRMDYVLFENLPHGISDDDASSILSLPNVPSPLSRPSTSMMVEDHSGTRDHSGTAANSQQQRRRPASAPKLGTTETQRNDDEDTFYDDRSLEYRIQRTLGHAPQALNMETPSSVPITPGGPMSRTAAAAASKTPWNQPAFHFQDSIRKSSEEDELANRDNMQSHRSAMAIMKLKQDLRNAVNNLYLFKQEKEAAESNARELAQRNEQLLEEQNSVKEQAKAIEEEREQMKTTKNELKACQEQLEKVTEENNETNRELQQFKESKGRLETENEELAGRIRSVLREHQEDLKSFGENTDARVSRLKGELEAANNEIESLKECLSKAKNEQSELETEKEKALADQVDLTEKHNSCLETIDHLQKDIETARSKNEEQIQQLEKQQEEQKAKEESDKLEISRLQKALQEANRRQSSTVTDDDQAQDETATKLDETQSELKRSQESLAERERELSQVKAESETQLQEIERLIAELGELKRNGASASPRRSLKHAACQTEIASGALNESAGTASGKSIQDRLFRIRDASERVALVKEHRNEIARLKAQHESQIKDITSLHETTLQERLDEETKELEAEHKEALEKLQKEKNERIASLEKRHRQEVERLKEEIKTNTKISDESLQVAMSKATSYRQRFERELTKREQLQEEANTLEKKFASEKQRLIDEHSSEVQSLKRTWTEEKNVLLNVIQRDCNSVFENNRNKSHASPKSVITHDFATKKHDEFSEHHEYPTDTYEESTITYSGTSPRYSNIDNELRETEALVQSLLGSKSEEAC